MRVATYNIHGAVGTDRRCQPDRIADVLREIDADLVALQEVDARRCGFDVLPYLAERAGYRHHYSGSTMKRRGGDFGNALLSRLPIIEARIIDLSVALFEPRLAIEAAVEAECGPVRVIATHFGLSAAERREQVERLLKQLRADWRPRPTLLLGDLNEWSIWGKPLKWLHAHFGEAKAPPSFPSRWPVLSLDRIWCEPAEWPRTVRAHRSALARIASDHLPVVADIEMPARRDQARRTRARGEQAA